MEQIYYNEKGFISENVYKQYSEKELETELVVRIVCDEKGRVIESKPTDNSVIYVPAKSIIYDDSNKLYQFSTFFPKGEGVKQKTYGTIIYDDRDRKSQIDRYDSMMEPIDESRTFEYDETGNLIEDTIYDDNEITRKYVYSYEKRKVILDEVYSSMTFHMDLYDSSASNYFLIFQ